MTQRVPYRPWIMSYRNFTMDMPSFRKIKKALEPPQTAVADIVLGYSRTQGFRRGNFRWDDRSALAVNDPESKPQAGWVLTQDRSQLD